MKRLLDNRLYLASICLSAVYILSIFNSTDYVAYWQLTNIKWLYFFFPVAIANYSFKKTEFRNLLLIAVGCAWFQSVYSLYYLFSYNSESLKNLYGTGNIINTFKIHHVQLSILYSILILILYSFAVKKELSGKLRIFAGIACMWFFVIVHVYAVRSGLVLTYLLLIGYTIFYIQKANKTTVVVFAGFILLGLSLLLSLSTIQNRIGYLRYDFEQYSGKSKDAMQYSDSRRLISINAGMDIILQHKFFGCGLSNIKKTCAEWYKKNYPDLDEKYYYQPHSQYIYFGACFGIFLGVVVCLLFIYPCFYFFQVRNYLFFIISFGLMLFALWDAWYGTLFGNCLYLLLIGFGSKYKWN